MPLIIIAGNPCVGKTSFAKLLGQYFNEKGINKISIINEELLYISKLDGYKNSHCEKNTRGALKSAVDQNLNSESYIILDSLNYIKGYRYELYCIARTFRTPHCVVWIDCSEHISVYLNNSRNSVEKYDDKMFFIYES
jgi:protein KTI12